MGKRIYQHLAFWLAYVVFKTLLNISGNLSGDSPSSIDGIGLIFLSQLCLLPIKIPMVYGLFYISEKYFSNSWSRRKSIGFGILVLLLSLVIFIPIKQFIIIEILYKQDTTLGAAINFTSLLSSFFILAFVAVLALSIKFVRMIIRQKEEGRLLEKQKLETELKFLKAQTNPHFLFNTLNNIYGLARKKADETPDAIMRLSKLLRFMLYESAKTVIPIADELKVIESYISLEKMRYSDRLNLSYTQNIDDQTQTIAPLILLPFIENAFKHGASENRFLSYINIEVTLFSGSLNFKIENSLPDEQVEKNNEKIGLVNVRRQLELMYPNHHLDIQKKLDKFSVELEINLSDRANI